MKVFAYNIIWSTDFHDTSLLSLPDEVGLTLEYDQSVDEIEEILEEKFGWPVEHVEYEEWDS